MSTLMSYAATAVAGLVAIVLVFGLLNLLRTDGANMSQKLMRWRVGLQFLVIILVCASALVAKYFGG